MSETSSKKVVKSAKLSNPRVTKVVDINSLEHVIKVDSKIRRLYKDHKTLDQKITELQSRAFLSAKDQAEIKNLKKKKLLSKDRMMRMLENYQFSETERAA